MSAKLLEVLYPGLLATVQDRGRYGYQRYGVPVSGALDEFALRVANILVGNDEGAACLEMTALGPRLKFLAETWIAVTGADLSPVLDDKPLLPWQSVRVLNGSILAFQSTRDGMRAYLAVAGGIDVPVVMGSRSTYLKGAIGGLEGRALRTGDLLSALTPTGVQPVGRKLPVAAPSYGRQREIRVVLGPQDRSFTPEGVRTFLSSKYQVSIQSDRMGYRLDGPPVAHVSGPDIISDGTPLGAVQVPGDGRPIILLADRGTTGGYTKIATVVGADIGRVAQAMPGDTLTFKAVTLEEAHAALREQQALLRTIRRSAGVAPAGKLQVLVEGQAFEMVDESGSIIAHPDVQEGPADRRSRHVRATLDGRTFEFDVEVQEAG